MNPRSPSFERLDYGLRSNKNIERKLVFDLLQAVSQRISFSAYKYLGFGSMWFSDFRIAHRALGIQKMISMERVEYTNRAEFNKPYASITVLPGDCLETLKGFSDEDWSQPIISWLDFDGALRDDVASSIKVFAKNCAPNSVLAITINGKRFNYASSRTGATYKDTSVGVVEDLLTPGVIPAGQKPQKNAGGKFVDVSDSDFPLILGKALLTYMAHQIVGQEREAKKAAVTFVPLFNVAHIDGVEMITIGGAFSSIADAPTWKEALQNCSIIEKEANGDLKFQRLDLIPITLKEKLALDLCLPKSEADYVVALTAAGVCLGLEEVKKYRQYYRHFPVFVESSL